MYAPLPAGFGPIFRSSPYLEMIGPIFNKIDELECGKSIVIGFEVQDKHCNAKGTAHGGIISGIADIALGYSAGLSQKAPISMVTTSLSIDFVGSMKLGDWVEVHADVQKVGTRVAFANCYFEANGKRVVRASGVFSVLN